MPLVVLLLLLLLLPVVGVIGAAIPLGRFPDQVAQACLTLGESAAMDPHAGELAEGYFITTSADAAGWAALCSCIGVVVGVGALWTLSQYAWRTAPVRRVAFAVGGAMLWTLATWSTVLVNQYALAPSPVKAHWIATRHGCVTAAEAVPSLFFRDPIAAALVITTLLAGGATLLAYMRMRMVHRQRLELI